MIYNWACRWGSSRLLLCSDLIWYLRAMIVYIIIIIVVVRWFTIVPASEGYQQYYFAVFTMAPKNEGCLHYSFYSCAVIYNGSCKPVLYSIIIIRQWCTMVTVWRLSTLLLVSDLQWLVQVRNKRIFYIIIKHWFTMVDASKDCLHYY